MENHPGTGGLCVWRPDTSVLCSGWSGWSVGGAPQQNVALWFGVTAFLFCVHSMVIALESEMKRPQHMSCILDLACLVVVGVNLPFAVYGYLFFGQHTQGYVFENLPGGWFNNLVRVFLSLELPLTLPIIFKPAMEVAEEILHNFLMLPLYTHTDWEKLSLALQFHGGVIRAVEQSQHFQVGAACLTILQRWLEGEGNSP